MDAEISGKPGRPAAEAAASHEAVMDAVVTILGSKSVRDLTMAEVAQVAGIGRPTLYKWWPTKSLLVLAMFRERLELETTVSKSAFGEAAVRLRVQRLIATLTLEGLYGRVVADLIAEGQTDAGLMHDFYQQHVRPRHAAAVDEIQRGVDAGELVPETNASVLVDFVIGAIYMRLLLRSGPLTREYGNQIVDSAFRGFRTRPDSA